MTLNRLISKPGVESHFHIDFEWWEREGRDFRVDVARHLRPEAAHAFASAQSHEKIDLVDAETAEVTLVDKAQYLLREQVRPTNEFITEHTSMVDAVFHLLLANGNRPMTPNELSVQLNRPAQTILRTLGGKVVYKGLRPIYD